MSAQSPGSATAVGQDEVGARGNKFLTLPNLLSLLRALLVIPFLLVMLSSVPSATLWGCLIIALAALTDKLDGVFARKYHQSSEWGRILDPLADKIGIAAGVIVLLSLNLLPLWFVALVFGRDLLILIGGLYLKSARGIVLPSNMAGKWTVGVLVLTVFVLVVGGPSFIAAILMVISTVLLLISFGLYVSKFADVARNPRGSEHGSV